MAYNVPKDLRYTKTHDWVKIEDGVATLGVSDYAQSELGDIVAVEMPEVGDAFSAGDQILVLEAVKAVEEMITPISGEVIEVNEELVDSPEIINSSCYEEGWLVKIKIENEEEIEELLTPEAYAELVE